MRNPEQSTKNRSFSKFLGQRRKRSFSQSSEKEIGIIPYTNLNFIRQNQGSIFMRQFNSGMIRCIFRSNVTGKKAFAYGATLRLAYNAMIRNFNLKYAS